jgi:GTP diphosphokinase / guanosine-3',5'-bis(diphosphate) 3'-diphosphatase
MAEKDATLTVINVIVMVHDRIHLAKIIKKLRMLSNVIRIQRL